MPVEENGSSIQESSSDDADHSPRALQIHMSDDSSSDSSDEKLTVPTKTSVINDATKPLLPSHKVDMGRRIIHVLNQQNKAATGTLIVIYNI